MLARTMEKTVLGIDISKKDFHVVCLSTGKSTKPRKFSNDSEGFEKLLAWLQGLEVSNLHACMEATSTYGEALAQFLVGQQFTVSIVNPARIKGFAKSELLRTKTDSVDAALIARFCQAINPSPWTPLPAEIKELQELMRRLEALQQMEQQERNRLETSTGVITELILSHLEGLHQQQQQVKQLIRDHFQGHPHLGKQQELLTSIPGIGELTASVLLAEIGQIENYHTARQLAAHAGLTPSQWTSGTSVQRKPRLSHTGNRRLRKALYMPAIVAMRHNPLLKAFSQRLLSRGKVKMQVIGAVMRKLLHLAFALLKSQKPFDPNYTIAAPSAVPIASP